MRFTMGYADGPDQQRRDQNMARGFSDVHPVPYCTPAHQDWIWGYDAFHEAKEAWVEYTSKKLISEHTQPVSSMD